MNEDKEVNVVPIADGVAHLQNIVPIEKLCYICHKAITTEETVLIRKLMGKKDMLFACTNHRGVIQEFVRQYRRVPMGWEVQGDPKNK